MSEWTYQKEEARPNGSAPEQLPSLVLLVVRPPPKLGLVLAHLPPKVEHNERVHRKAHELKDEPGEEDLGAGVVDLWVAVRREASPCCLDAEGRNVAAYEDTRRPDGRAREGKGWESAQCPSVVQWGENEAHEEVLVHAQMTNESTEEDVIGGQKSDGAERVEQVN